MKHLTALWAVALAGCGGGSQVDTQNLTGPPTWALVQERDLSKPKEGDDLVEHYGQCYVKFGRARDKHAITSRWIKNVVGQSIKSKQKKS